MDNIYSSYKVFVSSPSDVKEERSIVDNILDNINSAVSDSLKASFNVIKWEKLPPETEEKKIQDRLNELIKESHFFILILYKRYGSVAKGFKKSNTEREIDAILDCISKNEKKILISYFKKIDSSIDPGRQEKKVNDLKKRLISKDLLYKEFENQDDFKEKLTHDLYRILIRLQLSPYKNECLKKFWRFGKLESQNSHRTYLIYPPVPREWMAGNKDKNFWLNRLAPNVFFEDYKAIHKIKKCFALINYRYFQVFSKYSIPASYSSSNIIWLCLPRLEKALDSLKKYTNRRFEFFPRKTKTIQFLNWKDKDGKVMKVTSPLNKYLSLQRKNMKIDHDWNASLGEVFAKDFAVIARFNNYERGDYVYEECLKEYFIAGIRGLGTWGASWFIDRCYNKFNNLDDSDVQLLLEVSYYSEAIVQVKDVSNESQDYFNRELLLSTIKSNISKFK